MTDQPAKPAATAKPPKGRSPNYPGIALPKAIELARKLYEDVGQFELPIATITSKWGFQKPTTGPASVTYAAMKKFGLLEDHGTGEARVGKLTDLAVEILHPNSPNQAGAVERAALMPAIHREWWEKYGLEVPPWEALEWQLATKGPWTPNGLRDFLREYRETMTFAKPDSSAKVTREDPDPKGDDGERQDREEDDEGLGGGGTPDQPPPLRQRVRRLGGAGVKTYAIPVDSDHDAVIELPTPMTPARWENFKAFLTAMERVIVDHESGGSDPAGEES